jgi:CubicO group peptidase (beta-lactamase class C family)
MSPIFLTPMIPTRLLLAVSLFATAATLAKPADGPAQRLPRSTPEEQGISSSAILGFVQDAEQKIDALHSVMIVRHGHVVAEGWWSPFAASEPHVLFSLSKSFTSTAIGLAISEGRMSLDDTVLKFFPEQAPAFPSKNLNSMRVRDLLRMATGQTAEDIKNFPFDGKEDLVRVFLELPVPDIPGTHFVYNTSATFMLSAIIQKVTGQTVQEYLGPRLFDPLGMGSPKWDQSPGGISLGGFGLNIRTEDIACFGQLYLQKGQWHGKQIIPADWVHAATSLQIANGSDPASDWNQGYCYQFWRCRHGFFRGDGAFGQFCIVMPEFDTVVAITSGTGDLQGVLNLVWDRILPALGAASLPADADAQRKLSEKLASLSLRKQSGQPSSPTADKVTGRVFIFPPNPQHIESISLKTAGDRASPSIALRLDGVDQRLECGAGSWTRGAITTASGETIPVAASGAWSSEDTYSVRLVRYRTPFSTDYDVRFAGDHVILEALDNVGLIQPQRIRLVGTAQP